MGLHVLGDWDSPVMPIMVYHIGLLAALSRLLYTRHIAMVVVGFPATALLLCRCRVCISAAHTREDLDYALDAIRELAVAAGLDYNNKRQGQGLVGWWRRWAKSGFRLSFFGASSAGASVSGSGSSSGSGAGSRRTSSSSGSGDGSGTDSSCSSSLATSRASSLAGSWGAPAGEEPRFLKAGHLQQPLVAAHGHHAAGGRLIKAA